MTTHVQSRSGRITLALRLMLIAAFAGIGILAQAQGTATITTDLEDYPPGATVIITGSGFQAGENVILLVEHVGEDPTGTDPETHQPWVVIADGDGNVLSSWDVPIDGDALGATFLLTADGETSGLHAEWTFTDGNITISPSTVCAGGTFTLNASGFNCNSLPGGAFCFTWFQDNGDGIVNAGDTQIGQTTTNSFSPPLPGAGSYKYYVKGYHNGSQTASEVDPLIVTSAIANNTISADQVICGSATAPLTGTLPTGGTGAYTYRWQSSLDGSSFSDISGGAAANQGYTPGALSQTTYYKRKVTSGACAESLSNIISITVNSAPTASLSPNSAGICQGESVTLTIALTGSGTISGTLSDGTPFSGTAGSISVVLTPIADITYTITSLTNGTCSGTFTGSTAVTLKGKYTADAGADQLICPQTTATLNGATTGSPTTTAWTTSGSGTFANPSSVSTTYTPSPADITAGSVTLTLTASGGGSCEGSNDMVLTIGDLTNPTITAPAAVNAFTNTACTATGVDLGTPVTADNCTVASVTNNAPSAFPLGVTIVTWTVKDAVGNQATATQTVNVTDNVNPSITAPAAVSVDADANACTASGVALGTPTTSDNCNVASVINDAPSPFPIGPTTVTWTVTDDAGNSATATQVVTVLDAQKPTIIAPAAKTAFTNIACTATGVALGTPFASDNCTAVPIITNDAPAAFPLGTTTVTWKATDAAGNFQTATQLVTVTDNVQPTITTVSAKTLILNGTCSASLPDYRVFTTAADNCGSVTVTQSPAIGTVVSGAGVTVVTLTATDAAGNARSTAFNVTRIDNQIPVITTNGNTSVNNDLGACGALVTVSASATDNCGVGTPAGVRSDSQALTALFPVGITTITWNVSDINGNAAVAVLQTVTVTDNEKPVITASANITQTADAGQCGALVTIVAATATDNCGVGATTGTRSDALALNAAYPVGTTTITWNVTDIHGNAAVAVLQTVTVTDNEKPVITASANITQTADAGQCGALVSIVAATATDNCGVGATTGTRSDALALTAPFPVGTTTITWTVTDIHGNAADAKTQTVTVTDNEKPVITASANITQTADAGQCGALVTIVAATATDNCGVGATTGTRSDALALTAAYPVGVTTITWSVTDIHGNAADAKTQTVTVSDNENPVITASANITQTADAGQCGALVTIVAATATDNCGVGATIGTRSDALALNAAYPVGTTTITWTATDINGNAAIAKTQTVTVTDNEKPVITPAANITKIADAGQCSALVTIVAATATDNCGVGATTGTRSDALALTAAYPVGVTTITWTVTDINGNAAIAKTQTVTVTNPDPILNSITVPAAPIAINSVVSISASFTDNNVVSAMVTWDTGLTPTSTGVTISGSTVTATQTITVAGVYTVTITVTDACGKTVSITSQIYIVVYDPSGGFVTGGGWIISPPTAYVADPALTGKANFGFVSKYLKGATVPTGDTEFQFQVGNLNFKSTSYDWLVVSCTKAQYKGVGTINGSGNYGFLITALDGSPDKFRIKIWNKATSATVYDNQIGKAEDSSDATELGGGSIVVHDTKCKGSNAREATSESVPVHVTEDLSIEAYPNPLRETLSVKVGNPNNEQVLIHMMDVAGRSVIVKDGGASSDGIYQLNTESLQSGLYMLRVKVGSFAKTMKLIKE